MSDKCLDDAAGASPETPLLTVSDPRDAWLAKHAGHAGKEVKPAKPGADTAALECVDCEVAFAT